jgi:hypothetical protein
MNVMLHPVPVPDLAAQSQPGTPICIIFALQILSRHVGERDRKYASRISTLLKEPRNAPFERERFSCARAGDYSNAIRGIGCNSEC